MRPFNGTAQASSLQAAIAACSNPALVTYKDTAGLVQAANGLDTLGLHPTAANDVGIIAPGLLPSARAAILGYPTANSVAASDNVLVQQNGVTKVATIAQVCAAG